MLSVISAATAVFAGTNIDDMVILTMLFLAWNTIKIPKNWHIVLGQFIGIGVLVVISIVAALGLLLIPSQWVTVLGLIPIWIGVRGLIKTVRNHNHRHAGAPKPITAAGVIAVAGITITSGADNLAAYTPFFRMLSARDCILAICVFALLTGLWCFIASKLGAHKRVIALASRAAEWVVPVVYIGVGVKFAFAPL